MNVFRRGLSILISMALIISSIMAAGSTAVFAKETPQSVYSDVPETHWAYTAITELTKQNVVTGMGSGKFGTNAKVTRGQFVTFMARSLELETSSYAGIFKDVAKDKYYAQSIEAAANNGIVSGYSDEKFHPEAYITREQMAVMIVNAYSFASGKDIESLADGVALDFSDAKKISSWAVKAVKAATSTGIMSGASNGRFNPSGYATRAQGAMVIYNMLLAVPSEEPTPSPSPQGPTGIFINDSERGTGLNQFEFVPERNWHSSREYSASSYNLYNMDHTFNYVENETDYFQVRFKGTQIRIYGTKYPSLGANLAFSIDGSSENMIDTCAGQSTYESSAVIYESPVLSFGEHVLKCRIAGASASAPGNGYLVVDKAEIIGDPDLTQKVPPVQMYFDSSTTGTGLNQFNYTDGTPKKLNGYDTDVWTESRGYFKEGTACHYVDRGSDDAYMTFKFYGTQVALYTERNSWCGIIACSILDETGKEVVKEHEADSFSPSFNSNPTYVSEVLPLGTYILKARVTGKYNPANWSQNGERNWTFNVFSAEVSTDKNISLTLPEVQRAIQAYDTRRTGTGYYQFNFVDGSPGTLNGMDISKWKLDEMSGYGNDRGSADAYVSMKFYGTQAALYTRTGPDYGILACSILDENGNEVLKEEDADCYDTSDSQGVVYTSAKLPLGTYILKVRITGRTNPANHSSDGQKYWKAGIGLVIVSPDEGLNLLKYYVPRSYYKFYPDNEETGDGLNQFNYVNGTKGTVNGVETSSWETEKTDMYMSHYIDRGPTDSYFSFKFKGTQTAVILGTGIDYGIVECSVLDENGNVVVKDQEIDCYAEQKGSTYYISPQLTDGTYTLKVRITGKTNAENQSADGQKYWKTTIYETVISANTNFNLSDLLSR
jgi:hypothetical protein